LHAKASFFLKAFKEGIRDDAAAPVAWLRSNVASTLTKRLLFRTCITLRGFRRRYQKESTGRTWKARAARFEALTDCAVAHIDIELDLVVLWAVDLPGEVLLQVPLVAGDSQVDCVDI
jgi:hypothetical protein